jgi:hypothetical protein
MLAFLALALAAASGPWEALAPGLELGVFQGPAAEHGDGKITALRVDPNKFDLKLSSAGSEPGGAPRTAKEWARRAGGVAAINPSMFAPDGKGVSLLRAKGHVSNGKLGKDKAVLVFGPRKSGLPRARLLDRECDDVAALLSLYEGAAQSIRMFSCKSKNVWSAQPKRWSATAVGQDAQGRLLLLHVRTPYTMHALVDTLLSLPLGLVRLMYTEGGPEAQLYVGAGGRERELIGSWETGFREADDNAAAWPIPNALVVVPRGK